MSEALQIIEPAERAPIERFADVAPVISIEQAIARHQLLSNYVSRVMKEGHDYGAIPGTGAKPTLLKPGAEKLTTLFGLTKRLFIVEKIEDWSGAAHDGEPFFYYLYRCALYRGEFLIAEADGSCNSRESKYRWREAQRKCPHCGAAAIIKGKADFGGGWLCFGKKGGCGTKYADQDEAITAQQVGRIANPDVSDQVNTIQKMAAKRALVAVTLLAVNASEFFTQDIEDFAHTDPEPPLKPTGSDNGARTTEEKQSASGGASTTAAKPPAPNPVAQRVSDLATPKQIVMIRAICRDLFLDEDIELREVMKVEAKLEEITRRTASLFIDHLKQLQEGGTAPKIVERSVVNPQVVVYEAPPVTRPTIVPSPPQPTEPMSDAEFVAALNAIPKELPKWRFREIVQEFVQVEKYQPGDELDAIERDRAPMIQKLWDEAQFFVEKEKRAAGRKTSSTFWTRVNELHAGREFGMALFNKWTVAGETDWQAAHDELERSVAQTKAA